MNVCVKFANDKDSNRANVELLVPKWQLIQKWAVQRLLVFNYLLIELNLL